MEKLNGGRMRIVITDPSRVGEIRREATGLARARGFSEQQEGNVALIATEAATNLVKHAREGEIHLRGLSSDGAAGIELLAIDRGPGMADVEHCIRDGYSTAATLGTGLGAIARLADEFDVWSMQPSGTIMLARIYAGGRSGSRFESGEIAVPIAGETACGDAGSVVETNGEIVVLLADGLGHGPEAANASNSAVRVFGEDPALTPAKQIDRIHRALRATRGAAVAVAAVRPATRQAVFAGLGNISARIASPAGTRLLVSHNGTAGHHAPRIREYAYDWTGIETLVLHSDGINTHWKLEQWAGIARHHPAILAALLCRDESRGRDDASAVVARETRS